MMWHEFEQIAGYEVSYDDYHNIIEPMYLAIPESMTKQDFVKMLDKKRFALKPLSRYIKDIKEDMKDIERTCTHFTDYKTQEHLCDMVEGYIARKYRFPTRVHYRIDDKQLFSCYYPYRVVIYDSTTFETLEEIK